MKTLAGIALMFTLAAGPALAQAPTASQDSAAAVIRPACE